MSLLALHQSKIISPKNPSTSCWCCLNPGFNSDIITLIIFFYTEVQQMHQSVCKIKNVNAKFFILLTMFCAMILFCWKASIALKATILTKQHVLNFPRYHFYSTVHSQSDIKHISELHLEIWMLFCKDLADFFLWPSGILANNICVLETSRFCLMNLSTSHYKLYRDPYQYLNFWNWYYFA